jgi:hypothetical protein
MSEKHSWKTHPLCTDVQGNVVTLTVPWNTIVKEVTSERGRAFLEKEDPKASWAGATGDEALKMLEQGWITDRAKLDVPSSTATKFAPTLALEGAYPNVAAYLSGDPECMVAFTEETTKAASFLTVRVGMTAASNVTAQELLAFNKSVVSLVDSLEGEGYRIRLEAAISTSPSHNSKTEFRTHCIIPLKDYNEVIDEGQICFALGHPAFMRVIMFVFADCIDTPQTPWVLAERCSPHRRGRALECTRDGADILIPEYQIPRVLKRTIESELKTILNKE